MSSAADGLAALVDKYERLCALRARLGRGTPAGAERDALRALARDFPGALRELDTLDDRTLAGRLTAARAAAAGAPPPPWLAWTAAYHALMREALALRAGAATAVSEDARFAEDVRAPRAGRLNVVVFAALSRKFGVPAAQLWDTLFPRRGTAPRPYRDDE